MSSNQQAPVSVSVRRAALVALVSILALVVPAAASAATNPSLTGSVSDPVNLSGATAVAVSGHYAYTTAYAAGRLTAVDISNPASPVVAGESASSSALLDASTVNISGGLAYVVSKNRNGPKGTNSNDDGSGNSLTILDISTNPAVPAIVGSKTDAVSLFGGYGIAIAGHYAYVAAQGCLSGQPCPNPAVGNSFAVVDVSSPSTPTIVATLHNNSLPAPWAGSNALDHADSVFVKNNFAYVTASYSNKLTVIDISNPLNPTIVASLADPKMIFDVDVAVQGNFAYVANQGSTPPQLTVVDISNPASPKVVGSLTNSFLNGAYRIRLSGNFAYVSAVSALAVSAVDISDPTHPRLAAGLYSPAHLNHTTGLDVDPSGRYVIASSPFLSTQGFNLYPPVAGQPGGPTATGTVSVITLDPVAIAVSITPSSEPANPTQLTTANFAFSTNDSVASVSCQLDGAPLGLCTSATSQQYSSLGSGPHTFTVQATDSAGNTASASYAWTVTGGTGGPVNTLPPTISGSAVEAQALSAGSGSWNGSPAPTFSYQWQRCNSAGANCAPISGASAANYTLVAADVGSRVDVVVTAANSGGSTAASSTATAVVTSAPGPVTSLLDDFNRADNGGPPGASWSHLPTLSTTASNNLFVTSQAIAGPSGGNADYWNVQQFGPNSEAWITVVAKPTVNLDPVYLGLRFQSPTVANASGYQAGFLNENTTPDQYRIYRRTKGKPAVLASVTGPKLNAGDQLLFRAIGTTLELWRGAAGSWTRILTATDSTFKSGGYLALAARNSSVRLDNFGGGTLP